MKPARRPSPGWLLWGRVGALEDRKTAGCLFLGPCAFGGKAASEAGPSHHSAMVNSAARRHARSRNPAVFRNVVYRPRLCSTGGTLPAARLARAANFFLNFFPRAG